MSGFTSRLSATPTVVIEIALQAAQKVALRLMTSPVEEAGRLYTCSLMRLAVRDVRMLHAFKEANATYDAALSDFQIYAHHWMLRNAERGSYLKGLQRGRELAGVEDVPEALWATGYGMEDAFDHPHDKAVIGMARRQMLVEYIERLSKAYAKRPPVPTKLQAEERTPVELYGSLLGPSAMITD